MESASFKRSRQLGPCRFNSAWCHENDETRLLYNNHAIKLAWGTPTLECAQARSVAPPTRLGALQWRRVCMRACERLSCVSLPTEILGAHMIMRAHARMRAFVHVGIVHVYVRHFIVRLSCIRACVETVSSRLLT